jgi:hypothetical protein
MTLRFIVLAAVLACTSGCFSKPVAELHSVSVRSVSPQGLGLDMVMTVHNNNVFDVQVRHVRCSVLVAERFRMPPIDYNPEQWLPAGRSTYVHVPVLLPWPMITPLVAYTAGQDMMGYEVRGTVDVTAVRMLGITKNDYPFEDDGEVSRAQIMHAAMRGMGPAVPRRPY